MPIYEYTCTSCGHEFEAMQRISDAPLVTCPECHKPTLVKLVSAAGFRLKGGGWYETDFKQGDKRNLSQSDSAESSDSIGDTGSSTASKDKKGSDAATTGSSSTSGTSDSSSTTGTATSSDSSKASGSTVSSATSGSGSSGSGSSTSTASKN